MRKNLIYALLGGGLGTLASGLAVFFIEERRHLKSPSVEFAKAATEANFEQQLGAAHALIDLLSSQLEDEKFKSQQLLDAINTFCNEDDKANIIDLVNVRLNVRAMQIQGLDEETITDMMVRHKYKDLLKANGYISSAVAGRRVEAEMVDDYAGDDIDERFEEIGHPDVDPYLVSEEEYISNDGEYKQEVLTYFALDDTLSDKDDDIVDQSIVGVDNLKEFEKTDEPAIFIRNERLGIEYEIIWEDAVSYHKACLGVPDEKALLMQRIFRREEHS